MPVPPMDDQPPPEGGRAAERLQQFEEARKPRQSGAPPKAGVPQSEAAVTAPAEADDAGRAPPERTEQPDRT